MPKKTRTSQQPLNPQASAVAALAQASGMNQEESEMLTQLLDGIKCRSLDLM